MHVIGAGLPRTGTLSQKVALELLGFGPCYHMVNVLADLSQVRLWQAALDGNADFDAIFAGCSSTVDWPSTRFYKELADHYPEAKIVLSVRDPERWVASMRETVWGLYHGDSLIRHMSSACGLVDPDWSRFLAMIDAIGWNPATGQLADGHETDDGLAALMRRHTEEVRTTIPAERLLVWDVSEGWEPLCEFLQVGVPDSPMPRVNDTEEFKRRVLQMSLGKLQSWWGAQQPPAAPGGPALAPVTKSG